MQPIYAPLPVTDIEASEIEKRVLFFDPSSCYKNYTTLNTFKRINPRRMEQAFPDLKNGFCSCGCGKKLTGKQRRWASKQCTQFALHVTDIIAGVKDTIYYYLSLRNGGSFCQHCGCAEEQIKWGEWFRVNLEVDHINPVHKGGGACWLNNYQLICLECHKKKTISDL